MEIIQQLDRIGKNALEKIRSSEEAELLTQIRVQILGKKGELSQVLKGLSQVSPEERPKVGAKANEWKSELEQALKSQGEILSERELNERVKNERIDTSLPSRLPHSGGLHPLTQTIDRMVEVFSRLGFEFADGPEIETEYLNFDSINIPKDHPARDMQDTFFVGPGLVLRTHTSPVQMRAMLEKKDVPVRVICPGAVYRLSLIHI